MQTYFMDLFTVIAACWFYSSNLERSTSQKVCNSKKPPSQKVPSQTVYMSKCPQVKWSTIIRSRSQKVPNQKITSQRSANKSKYRKWKRSPGIAWFNRRIRNQKCNKSYHVFTISHAAC